ncbi:MULTISPECIES: MFS transporter [unclassified Nocardioides]|uniref:MFS transporter n=1 Tax=unclassified Nocardioides TaxID=2615069 RepID=UPI003014AD93
MTSTDTRILRARIAVIAAFGVNGFLLASWVVSIPQVEDRAGLSHASLGSILLLLGLGSFVSMQVGGWAVDRVGSRVVTMTAVAMLAVAVTLPSLATGAGTLALAVLAIGLGNGALDVAMNSHAVQVERAHGRPLMSGFHACWSIGGAIGAGVGAIARGQDVPLGPYLAGSAIAGAAVAAVTLPGLLPPYDAAAADEAVEPVAVVPPETRRIVGLALLAFVLMLAEGVAADWSALHARDHLDAGSLAALAYAAFAVAMTAGRLVADRVTARIGAVAVVRWGALVAGAGMLVAVLSPALPLTLVGWALFGLGLSGTVPQIFSAAGAMSAGGGGVIMSRIVGAGYLGLLAGPALIGWLAAGTSLTLALVLPAALCVLAVRWAGLLRTDGSRHAGRDFVPQSRGSLDHQRQIR